MISPFDRKLLTTAKSKYELENTEAFLKNEKAEYIVKTKCIGGGTLYRPIDNIPVMNNEYNIFVNKRDYYRLNEKLLETERKKK